MPTAGTRAGSGTVARAKPAERPPKDLRLWGLPPAARGLWLPAQLLQLQVVLLLQRPEKLLEVPRAQAARLQEVRRAPGYSC